MNYSNCKKDRINNSNNEGKTYSSQLTKGNHIEPDNAEFLNLFGHAHIRETLTPLMDTEGYVAADISATMKIMEKFDKMLSPRVKWIKENKKAKKGTLVDPIFPDENYPIKGYYNDDAKVTVLVFKDGSKIKLTSDTSSKGKNVYNGILIALTKRILGSNVSVNGLYNQFKTDTKTEAAFYGIVMGYFVSKNIVRDSEMFNRWMSEFIVDRITIQK